MMQPPDRFEVDARGLIMTIASLLVSLEAAGVLDVREFANQLAAAAEGRPPDLADQLRAIAASFAAFTARQPPAAPPEAPRRTLRLVLPADGSDPAGRGA